MLTFAPLKPNLDWPVNPTSRSYFLAPTIISNESLIVPSVTDIFASADWYEREAYDLFGVLFEGHQDLRRILTDYGFIGHPFRKKFPLVGNTQVRYDPEQRKVVNEPVDIEPRTLVPKVIRKK